MISPSNWEQIRALFHTALEHAPDERAAFLCSQSSDDEILREVASLLAAHADAGAWRDAARGDDAKAAPARVGAAKRAATLACGVQLGPYVVVSPLGAGAMGEVYRGRDTNLRRDVALKILPESLAADPDRLARFTREARTLGALNHPHIAQVYGFEQHGDVRALVMELVEGQDLAAHIARGSIRVPDALRIARQIAEALEAAHARGIVHRDLKPANIMIREDGTVKVLDFGLAKVWTDDFGSATPPVTALTAPTIVTTPPIATEIGALVGTAAYMSPEQARGGAVDKGSDIWAFGCVLYEMLTGTRAFDGANAAEALANVLQHEPAWDRLPAATPSAMYVLLRRCLRKERRERLQDAAGVRIEIDDALRSSEKEPVQVIAHPRTRYAAAVGIVGAAVVALAWYTSLVSNDAGVAAAPETALPLTAYARPLRFRIDAPVARAVLASVSNNRLLAISPDGAHITYVSGGDASRTLVVHALEHLEGEPLSGTANAQAPFFSPDGKTLGFFDTATMELRRVPMAGGAARTVCKLDDTVTAASWGANDVMVFATRSVTTGLMSVPAAGGQPTVLTRPDASQNEADHLFPSVLPGGRQVLFTIARAGGSGLSDLALLNLDSGRYVTLIPDAGTAEYLESGHVLYESGGTLYGAKFDPARGQPVGDPIAVEKGIAVERGTGAAQYAVSRTGTLVYIPAAAVATAAARSLVAVDRRGREEVISAPPRVYHSLRLSPDGMRVAVDIRDEEADTWVLDFRRPSLQRVTFSPRNNPFPVWTPDGRWIVTGDAPGLVRWPADGTGAGESLTSSDHTQFAQAFTPDGRTLLLTDVVSRGNNDLHMLTLDGTKQTRPLVTSPFSEGPGDLSRDGRWLAYQQSDRAGRKEIYISPFPDVVSKRQLVSLGTQPVWAHNGRELFFIDGSGMLTSATIRTSPELGVVSSTELFSTLRYFSAAQGRSYDVWPDRQRFLFITDAPGADRNVRDNASRGSLVVVVNWIEELKARVAKN